LGQCAALAEFDPKEVVEALVLVVGEGVGFSVMVPVLLVWKNAARGVGSPALVFGFSWGRD
jgi:hypothetical protein